MDISTLKTPITMLNSSWSLACLSLRFYIFHLSTFTKVMSHNHLSNFCFGSFSSAVQIFGEIWLPTELNLVADQSNTWPPWLPSSQPPRGAVGVLPAPLANHRRGMSSAMAHVPSPS